MATLNQLEAMCKLLRKHGVDMEESLCAEHDEIFLPVFDEHPPFEEELRTLGAFYGHADSWMMYT